MKDAQVHHRCFGYFVKNYKDELWIIGGKVIYNSGPPYRYVRLFLITYYTYIKGNVYPTF